jgi:hypothetical protein
LLGLFAFGILTHRKLLDRAALWICLAAPLLTLCIDGLSNAEWFVKRLHLSDAAAAQLMGWSAQVFGTYRVGIELLLLNGIITFLGLWLFSKKSTAQTLTADV